MPDCGADGRREGAKPECPLDLEHDVYISELFGGYYYIAEYPKKPVKWPGQLIWIKVPHKPISGDIRLEPFEVPAFIRKQAYNMFESDRARDSRDGYDRNGYGRKPSKPDLQWKEVLEAVAA